MTRLRLEAFMPYRLNRIGAVVSQNFRVVYAEHDDLSVSEWRVLATLGQFEELGAKAIGRHSAMHKTKVSRAVRALEERHWLKRRQRQEDRREDLLMLTAAGRRVYDEIVPKALAFEAAIRTGLGVHAAAFETALRELEALFKL